jgi:hypothetical protein
MDVVVWLRSLGLGKYEAAFRENDIDESVLPSLTHEARGGSDSGCFLKIPINKLPSSMLKNPPTKSSEGFGYSPEP